MRALKSEGQIRSGIWHSPFLALLWKEWRHQRSIFLFFTSVGTLSPWIVSAFLPDDAAILHIILAGLFLWVFSPAILAGNCLAGEHDTGTERFLWALPASRGTIVNAKIFTALGLSFIGTLPHMISVQVAFHTFSDEPPWMIGAAYLVPLLLVGLAGTVASLRTSTLSCILFSLLAGGLLAGWVSLSGSLLDSELSGPFGEELPFYCVLGLLCVAAVLVLIEGRRLAAQRTESSLSRAFRLTRVYAGFLAVTVLPGAAIYLYVIYFKGPAEYVCHGAPWAVNGSLSFKASPSGKQPFVALNCDLDWSQGRRVAILDTGTGKWQWIDRYRESVVLPARETPSWSPDGSRVLVMRSTVPLCPFEEFGEATYWALQPDTKAWTAISMQNVEGWFDDRTVFDVREDGVAFLDLTTGQEAFCANPELAPGESEVLGFRTVKRTDTAVLKLARLQTRPGMDECALSIRWYQPSLSTAEETRSSQGFRSWITWEASDDGAWLAGMDREDPEMPMVVISAKSGELQTIQMPQVGISAGAPQWVPGSHRLALISTGKTGKGLWIYDLDHQATWDFHAPPEGWEAYSVTFSPRGVNACLGVAKLNRKREHALLFLEMATGQTHLVSVEAPERIIEKWNAEWAGDERFLIERPSGIWEFSEAGKKSRLVLAMR